MGVAVLFPGQGSQFTGMVDVWLAHPASAPVVHEAGEVLGYDVAAAARDEDALARTDVVQPAMLTCEVAAWRVLEDAGLQPVAAAGHSLGEYAALVAAGAVDFGAAVEAVKARALAMQRACEERPGTMLAVMGMPADEVAALCKAVAQPDELVVANENSPVQTVVAGTVEAVERAAEEAKARGGHPVRVPVAGAFHSPLMEPALGWAAAAVARLDLREPRFPVVANVSGEPTTDPTVIEDLLCRHLVSPVRWVSTMEAMAALGADVFVEAGPGNVLARLVKRCLPGATVYNVGAPDDVVGVPGTGGIDG